jgi:hypothetical protein
MHQSPIQLQYFFLDATPSGDKKAHAQSMATVHGKKVSAEGAIPAFLVDKRLQTSPQRMADLDAPRLDPMNCLPCPLMFRYFSCKHSRDQRCGRFPG